MTRHLALAAAAVLAACSYDIVPPPPPQLQTASDAPLQLRVGVVDEQALWTRDGKTTTPDNILRNPTTAPAQALADALRASGLFASVDAAPSASPQTDLLIALRSTRDYASSAAWFIPMFLPMCDPLLVGCGYRYEDHCSVDETAALRAPGKSIAKEYSAKKNIVASHTAGINNGSDQEKMRAECFDSAVRHAADEIARALLKDRARFAPLQSRPASDDGAPAPTTGEAAPWWKR